MVAAHRPGRHADRSRPRRDVTDHARAGSYDGPLTDRAPRDHADAHPEEGAATHRDVAGEVCSWRDVDGVAQETVVVDRTGGVENDARAHNRPGIHDRSRHDD